MVVVVVVVVVVGVCMGVYVQVQAFYTYLNNYIIFELQD